ncbi:MAG: TraB/GumN family protein [Lewinellaceae bacterium]|nr:TraB/GumN family protein [Lewinellaceae bacterium]
MLKNSLLWRFQLANSVKEHYLFGSMHVRTNSAINLAENLSDYISKCNLYAAETDLDELNSGLVLQKFELPQGTNLIELIGEKKFQKCRKIVYKSFDLDIKQFTNYSPLFTTNLITASIINQDHQVTMDDYLWKLALSLGLERCGVESVEDQIKTFEKIEIDIQVKQLLDVCKNVNKYRKMLEALQTDYGNQQLTKLYKRSKNSMGSLRKPLIFDRNEKMTERILNLAGDNTLFVVVGAAHLPGGKGIIRGLKKNGVKIEPVYFNS